MTKKLIVNADDYGRTAGVSAGIRKAHLEGIVTSTSCMMNLPGIEENITSGMRACPNLGMGVHLNLTYGQPLNPVREVESLVSRDGRFAGQDGFIELLPGINFDQVEAEWGAQIHRFVAIAGRAPTHLDSHHHSSYFTPQLFSLMLRFAQKYGCAIRFSFREDELLDVPGHLSRPADLLDLLRQHPVPHPDGFIDSFYDEGATLEHLVSILTNLPDGIFEIMSHPGFADADLDSSYARQRERELKILTDPKIRDLIAQQGIQLIHFGG